jgi:isopenicillin-N N-acyltransferase-like protein
MFGAWGQALADSSKVLQMRALDWDMDGPFRDYSQITVYHPNEGHAFANIGIAGFIGGLTGTLLRKFAYNTGVSETQLGISEIGAAYADATFGSESRIGLPFIVRSIILNLTVFSSFLEISCNSITI